MSDAISCKGRNLVQAAALALIVGLMPLSGSQALEVFENPSTTPPVAGVPIDFGPMQQQLSQVRPAKTDLNVAAWVDRQDNTYAVGEPLTLWVQTSRDAYITVVSVPASGGPTIVFPNEHVQGVRVRAGEPMQIPGANAGYKLKVGGPTGTDLIKIFASETPVDLRTAIATQPAGPFKSIVVEPAEIGQTVQFAYDAKGEGGSWTSYDKVIRVVERAAPVPAPMPAPASLQIRTDRQAYRLGEAISFRVASTEDCHLTVIGFDALGGPAVQLFPNAYQPNGFLPGGGTVLLPSEISGVQFIARGPVGIETLVARCGPTPASFEYRSGDPAFRRLENAAEVQRSLAVVPMAGTPALNGQATTSYIIVE